MSKIEREREREKQRKKERNKECERESIWSGKWWLVGKWNYNMESRLKKSI